MSHQPTESSLFGDVVFAYTRAQALADGVLVDASALAREAGFRWPVALTAAAWENCVAWGPGDTEAQVPQDATGRLWDVLILAAHAARTGTGAMLYFDLHRVPRDGRARRPTLTTLKLILGPGDAGEPVMTILQPEED
jgi:hypothetical protein